MSHVIGHNLQVDPMSLTSHSRVTLEALMSILCDSAKVATLDQFQDWLVTDLRPCRVTYEFPSDIRPICEGLATDIRASPELVTREKFPDRFEPFHTVGELVPSDGESPELLRVIPDRFETRGADMKLAARMFDIRGADVWNSRRRCLKLPARTSNSRRGCL